MNEAKNKNYIYFIVAAGILVLATAFLYFFYGEFSTDKIQDEEIARKTTRVIEENLVLPNTQKVTAGEARIVKPGSVSVPLMLPPNEEIVSSNAVFTLKGSYNLAFAGALGWSSDAKLVFIKSLGAVLPDGKSSQWQIVFGSPKLKKGYEIIVQANQIVSKKEVVSDSFGFDLPRDWYDSDEAIKNLQNMPQFSGASLSSINFYYNTDGKKWGYALATSRGVTSMPVR